MQTNRTDPESRMWMKLVAVCCVACVAMDCYDVAIKAAATSKAVYRAATGSWSSIAKTMGQNSGPQVSMIRYEI